MLLASRIQIAALLAAIAAMLGQKLTLLPFRIAFSSFGIAMLLIVLLGLAGLLNYLWSLYKGRDTEESPALRMFTIGVIPLAIMLAMIGPGLGTPRIHDITTDLENPPQFIAAKDARSADQNSTEYEGEAIASQQREAYPDIQPIYSELNASAAFARSQRLARELGWRMLSEDSNTGRLEAYDETLFFGFKDDVVIRVLSTEEGSRIDLRSNSRVGLGDLGANAARIRRFAELF